VKLRPLVAALATVTVLLAAMPDAPAGASVDGRACDGGAEQILRSDRGLGSWHLLPPPPFPAGSPGLQAHAIDRANPLRWYVTDGRTVLASHDGGCRWHAVLTLPSDRPDDRVGKLEVGPPRQGPGTLWAAIEHQHLPLPADPVLEAEPTVTSRLVRSDDGGATWDVTAELPFPFGRTTHLVVAPSDPDRIYAAVWGRLQASSDRGGSWDDRGFLPYGPGDYLIPPEPVGRPPEGVRELLRHRQDPTNPVEQLVVDHHDPDRLWATSPFRAYASPDAAMTWRSGVDDPGKRLPVVISRPGTAGTAIVPYHRYSGGQVSHYEVTDDGGAFWDVRPVEEWGGRLAGAPQSATVGWRGGDVVLTTFDRGLPAAHFALSVYRLAEGQGRFVDIDEFSLAPLYDVQSDLAPTPAFFFRSADRLVIHVPFEREEAGGDAFDPGPGATPTPGGGGGLDDLEPGAPPQRQRFPHLEPRPVAVPEPAEVTVSPASVVLAVGEEQLVDVTVRLPPRPTPLDLFLLLDSSGSTSWPVRHLALELQDLVDALAAEGVGLRVGVGSFTDYPFLPWGSDDDHAYRLHHRVADLRRDLPTELNAAHGSGEGVGTLVGSSALTALFQAATGAGQADPAPPGAPASQDPSIPAGLEAGFGTAAAPVVVTMTDVPFYDAPGHPGPARAEVLNTLGEHRIRQLGIATGLGGSHGGSVLARPDLEQTARATGALARRPVPCGGTGPDVAAAGPLVCTIDERAPEGIAAVTAALALALPDEGGVSVRTTEGGAGGSPSLVDLHEGAPAVQDQVVVACREGDPPVRTVGVDAVLERATTGQSGVVGTASVSVRCRGSEPAVPEAGEDEDAPGTPAPANPTQPGGVAPAQPPPPPVPVPAAGPAPAPASSPAPAASSSGVPSQVANPASAGAPSAVASPATGTAQGTAPAPSMGVSPGPDAAPASAASASGSGGSAVQAAAAPGGGGASPAVAWDSAGGRSPLGVATVHHAANARTAAATVLMAGTSLLLRRRRAAQRHRLVRVRSGRG
jgi:hypothetical protein